MILQQPERTATSALQALPYLAALLLLLLSALLLRRLASPLTRLPGPWYTALSHLPITYHDSHAQRSLWTQRLHATYGPIVRLSPSEISFFSASAVREIYTGGPKTGGFPKTGFTRYFKHFGASNAFTSVDGAAHAWRRRIVAGSYAVTPLLAREARSKLGIWRRVGGFAALVAREGVASEGVVGGKVVDVFSAARFYALDNVTAFLFGDCAGTAAVEGDALSRRFTINSRERPEDVLTYFKMRYPTVHAWTYAFKHMVDRLGLSRAGVSMNDGGKLEAGAAKGSAQDPDPWMDRSELRAWAWDRYQTLKTSVSASASPSTNEDPVAARLAVNVLRGDKEPDGTFAPDDPGTRICPSQNFYADKGAVSECLDHLIAGIDTMADTLSYVICELSRPENVGRQRALRDELCRIVPPTAIGFDAPLDHAHLTALMAAPLLDAVVKETLRRYPASATSLPRAVPVGGRELEGYFVPQGTTVSATTWAIGQESQSFDPLGEHDVTLWAPERWLESGSESAATMNKRLWTFGSGGRACVGKNFAVLEMKLLLAGIYTRYRTFVDDSVELDIRHGHWIRRSSFRDIVFFEGFKGGIGFAPVP